MWVDRRWASLEEEEDDGDRVRQITLKACDRDCVRHRRADQRYRRQGGSIDGLVEYIEGASSA